LTVVADELMLQNGVNLPMLLPAQLGVLPKRQVSGLANLLCFKVCYGRLMFQPIQFIAHSLRPESKISASPLFCVTEKEAH
jgi:hypothetical protein